MEHLSQHIEALIFATEAPITVDEIRKCLQETFEAKFKKEEIEEEIIFILREDYLERALVVNYSILLFAILFVYDMTFLHVLFFNMFTPLIFFVIRFTVLKSKYLRHEE